MKRYQVFMESVDGCGQGQTHDLDTLELAWSWLDLTFASDAVAQLWWVKDRQACKAVADMSTEDSWNKKYGDPREFISNLRLSYGWAE